MVKLYTTHHSKNLPDLKIKKETKRQEIEEDLSVKKLISSHQLINYGLIDTLKKNLEINEKIKRKIEDYQKGRIPFDPYFDELFDSLVKIVDIRKHEKYLRNIFTAMREGNIFQLALEEKNPKIKELLLNTIKNNNNRTKKELIDQSNNIVDSLIDFGDKTGKQLDITIPAIIYSCSSCWSFVSLDQFITKKCLCGNEINSIKKVETFSIRCFSDSFSKFINNNFWLEHGVDIFLKKQQNCSSICGYYVLGHSGVDHETDNIVEFYKGNVRVLIECKNVPNISVENIFTLYGKMTDIGCIKGYLISTAPQPDEILIRLAKAKNIEIIPDIFKGAEKKLGESFSSFL